MINDYVEPFIQQRAQADLFADLLAVINSSHKVAIKMPAFPRHICPEGRSQQVSEAGPSVRICNVEKEH